MNTGAIVGGVVGTVAGISCGVVILVAIGIILCRKKYRPLSYERMSHPARQPKTGHATQQPQQPQSTPTLDPSTTEPTLTETALPSYEVHQKYPTSTEPPSTNDDSKEPPYESSDVSFHPPVGPNPPTSVPYPAVPAVI